MSRAFVKDMDDVPPVEPAVARPQSRPMTRRGLAALKAQRAHAGDDAARKRLDDLVVSALVVDPPQDRAVAAFGAKVTVAGAGPKERTFSIVGEDEIDVESGRIGASSPLGSALLGSRAGDRVVWTRPAGEVELTVRRVSYDR